MKSQAQEKRQKRVRTKIQGTGKRPRLSVFRSNRHMFTQLIDDEKGRTLLAVSENTLDRKDKQKKTERARSLGQTLAKKALEKKITSAVFDKGAYKYHGRVKALADGAREGGLVF